ncbi:retrovirus-related pol polyprotein from transposon TNT 1-94 [Tanacetum coccineum]
MTTLAEHIIVAGAENRPLMLEKSMYDSWASRIRLFIKGKKHGRMMLDSIDNGPLVYPTVEENGQTRPKKYSELTEAQQLQDDCDVQAKNIILHGLPPDVYALVNHQEEAKDIWDRLINDMHTIRMTMQQVQVNTKFLNALPSEWSKFVTDVKLAKSLYTTNYDQLYAYLSQHERHANEVRINRERYLDSLAFVANSPTLYNPSYLDVPMFQQGEDPIECINKAMAFLSVVASKFPTSNNQLRTSSNPRNQATIQDDRGNVAAGPSTVVKYYNCQGEGHIARQCTQPKRPRNAAWFKEKLMLAEAQEAAFQIDDLDAYDLNCDDLSSAKAVLMANLLSCDPEVLSEVPYSDSYSNDMINQDVQEMQYYEQTHVDDFKDNEIHSVLSMVEQMTDHVAYLDKENQTNKMVNESLTAELERYKERIAIEDKSKEKESKYIDKEIVLEKQNKELENFICKMYRSTQAMHMLTKPQVFYDDTHKQALGYQNMFHLKKAQRIQPTLYDGSVIEKEHAVIFVIDDEETLILEKESRSKMLDKQNDPISIEKKIKISPIDYSKLNKIKEDFEKHFVTQKELSATHAFWLKHSSFSETPVISHTPVRIEAPSELPKVSLVNESLKKLKYQLASFDKVVKKRLTSYAITTGSWGFELTKEYFVTEIIPFLKVLKDTFNAFDKTLLDEITEVQTVFNQMEVVVD